MKRKIKSNYGSWESEISPQKIVEGGLIFSEIRTNDSNIYFLEGRPSESGRYVIVRQNPDGSTEDMFSKNYNSRNAVHEYGGGSFAVGKEDIYFSNWEDQRIYSIKGKDTSPITEEPDNPRALRYADLTLSNDEKWLFCVRETHFENKEAKNELVAVSTEEQLTVVISSGRDFYSSPRQNPLSNEICWLEWDHPNMPWDGSELFVGDFESKPNMKKS